MTPILEPRRRWSRPAARLAAAALAAGALWLGLRDRSPPSIPRDALSRDAVQGDRARPTPASSPPQLVVGDGDEPSKGELPPPIEAAARTFHPRDPNEWQGMPIRTDEVPPCEESATCGLARACKDGQCVACAADLDCASGEVCALDHCVVSELASCRRRADCPGGQLCVLGGYSAEARGNEGMRAYCLDPAAGSPAVAEPEPVEPDPRTTLPDDDLLRAAEAARAD